MNIRRRVKDILHNAVWRETLKESIKQSLIKDNSNKENNKPDEIKRNNIEKHSLEENNLRLKTKTNNSKPKIKANNNTIKETNTILKQKELQPESNNKDSSKNNKKDNLKIKIKLNQNKKHNEETVIQIDNNDKVNQEMKDKEIIQTSNNTHQNKWKNIMTLIHNSALQNINRNCGENCILRRQISESDISSGKTVSIHSGTDSQYERISPDNSPERQEEDMILSEDSITDALNSTFNNNNSPEKPSETHQNFNPNDKNKYEYLRRYPEEEHNYPRGQQEERRWRYMRERRNSLPEEVTRREL